ncbi:MAG: MutS-related protein, partial [Candidatus Halalkalibacterium sp. M3_1C_030]
MSSESKSVLERAIKNLLERVDDKISALEMWDKRLSMIRLAIFIAGIALLYLAAQYENSYLFYTILALFISSFIFIASYHRKISGSKNRFKLLKKIKAEHLARMQLDWPNIPEATQAHMRSPADHPYAEDFNITGRHSLMQLIDTAIYPGGTDRLKEWLLKEEPQLSNISRRQDLSKELKPMIEFRDKLRIKAAETKSQVSENDWTMEQLLDWLGKPSGTKYGTALSLLGFLSATNIVLGILYLVGILDPYVIFTFVVYLIVYNFNSDKVKGLFNAAYQMDKLLSRFSSILLYLERYPFKESSELKDFLSTYREADSKPSRFLKKVARLSAAASSQQNEILWFLLNAVVPWDLYYSYKLDNYKAELKPKLSAWLDKFYDLEALCSLSHFAWLNPHYNFEHPVEPGESDKAFEAKALGHPLIPENQKVTNDLTIDNIGNLILLTGSNMAGKSTFLRTVGINLCLCFAGGPVNADNLKTVPFRLFSSINVKDSLDQGLSHFYAEVKRLRKLLDELNSEHSYPLFFFVDEIYRGTNNRERLRGSN